VGGFPALELGATGLLLLKELMDGLRALEVILGRRVAGGLGAVLLGGLLGVILLGRRVLGVTMVLLGLLRTEGFETLGRAGGLLERAGALTLELLLLTGEGRWVLEAAELFATVWLFWLLPLDLLLLRVVFAVTGSANNIKAEIIVNKTTLTFVEFFSVNIACLLNLNLSYNTHTQISNTMLLFYPLKASTISPVTGIPRQNPPFRSGWYLLPKHHLSFLRSRRSGFRRSRNPVFGL